MGEFPDLLAPLFGDRSASVMLGVLVFLGAATLAFCGMVIFQTRAAVRRRAAGIRLDHFDGARAGARTLQHSSVKAAQRLVEYTTKHYTASNHANMKMLRRRLIQAGIYDPRAVALFFIGRSALAIAGVVAAIAIVPMLGFDGTVQWLFVGAAGVGGYVGPSVYLDMRLAKRRTEHRAGFPDFMDLLVVCADAGVSMEAALERVGRELSDAYPSLSANIHMANLEIRAGRSMTDALEHLSDRLALEEARSFATLIQQSAELGSSITDALRVYSDDMRHKRLSRAEEKAYALPAKLSLPMMVCIFPVIFVVILLPVIVRLYSGSF